MATVDLDHAARLLCLACGLDPSDADVLRVWLEIELASEEQRAEWMRASEELARDGLRSSPDQLLTLLVRRAVGGAP